MMNIKKNIVLYSISTFCILFSKSLPHACLTMLLFNKGIDISKIIFIQMMFSMAVFIFEIPSGVWSDMYSRKVLYLVSHIFLIIAFYIIYKSTKFEYLCFAWFIYGFSDALGSGTLDAQIVNDIKSSNYKLLDKFIKNINRIGFISLIFGSTIGSYCYFRIREKIYILGIIFIIISFVLISFFDNYQVKVESKINIKYHLKEVMRELKINKELKLYIFIVLVIQIFFQTHFQLWQALFLDKGFDKNYLFVYYIIFQIIGIISYSFDVENLFKHFKKVFLIMFFLPFLFIIKYKSIFILLYCIFVLFYTTLNFYLNLKFTKAVSKENISSISSFKASISRIGSILVLIITSFLLKFVEVNYLIIFNFLLVNIILVFILKKSKMI